MFYVRFTILFQHFQCFRNVVFISVSRIYH
nr:MAG TPA: hypothetical protein [Caudoviricetes sp.]